MLTAEEALICSVLPVTAARVTPSPGPGRRGDPAKRRVCGGSLLPLRRGLWRQRRGGRLRREHFGVGAGSSGADWRVQGREAAGGALSPGGRNRWPGPPTRPSGLRAWPLPAAAAPESGEGGSGPPPCPAVQAELAGHKDRRTDGRLGTATGGPAGPRPPLRPGRRLHREHKRHQGGRGLGIGPPRQSLQPATRPPPSLGPPATRGPSRSPASSRLLVPPCRRPSSPASRLSGQPERRLPGRLGVTRGGGGAGLRPRPGAADHGAPA